MPSLSQLQELTAQLLALKTIEQRVRELNEKMERLAEKVDVMREPLEELEVHAASSSSARGPICEACSPKSETASQSKVCLQSSLKTWSLTFRCT